MCSSYSTSSSSLDWAHYISSYKINLLHIVIAHRMLHTFFLIIIIRKSILRIQILKIETNDLKVPYCSRFTSHFF